MRRPGSCGYQAKDPQLAVMRHRGTGDAITIAVNRIGGYRMLRESTRPNCSSRCICASPPSATDLQ